MEFLRNLLLVLHFVGLAVLFGGFAAQIGQAQLRITAGMLHGAILQLVSGMALMGVRAGDDAVAKWGEIDNTKMTVKLVILVAIFVIVVVNRKKERVGVAPWLSVGLLTLTNVAIAVFWT